MRNGWKRVGSAYRITLKMLKMHSVEWILGLAVLAVGLAPLVHTALGTAGRQASMRRLLTSPASLVVLAGVVAVLLRFVEPAPRAPEPPPFEARVDGYVSSNTCRSCHPREYAAWHASYHRTMTQRVNAGMALGDFNDVELELDGVAYRLSRRGDTLWARWEGVDHQLVLATGSHHDQMYWYQSDSGKGLQQFAFDYSRRSARWIPTRSSFLAPPGKREKHFAGEWSAKCAKCHAVHSPRHPKDPRRVAEFGIACEACHGPAEEHVAAHRNPVHRIASRLDEAPDPTIVHPKRLDSHRSAAVCGQCHGVIIAEAGPYRPGDDIHPKRLFLQLRYLDPNYQPQNRFERERQLAHLSHRASGQLKPRFILGTLWRDGAVRVSGREFNGLLESPCFERGEMSCSSCHTLHQQADDPRSLEQWANDQVSVGMEGNEACLQCHSDFQGVALVEHTHHESESTGNLCYNCHMSYSVYGIQKAHRSHTVASPSVAESVDVGRPNACNQCHLDRTLAWTARNLSEWYGIDSPVLTSEESTVAAGARWALRGDAGMRALMAWSMGWEAAREASGATGDADWMIPYLAELLDDPYDSVRFVALLALRKRAEFARFDYNFVGTAEERRAAAQRAGERGIYTHGPSGVEGNGTAVLLDASGALEREAFARLLRERDDRPIALHE